MQKTGTKWLQRHVFPTIEGATPTNDNRVIFELLLNLTHHETFMSSTLETALREIGGRVLMSWECLAGMPWGDSDIDRNVSRLASVTPDAQIIVVKRDRGGLKQSLYGQYVNRGGWADFATFEQHVLRPEYLDVEAIIDRFATEFDRILVLDYQQLKTEPDAAIRQIERFAGVRFSRPLKASTVNPSLRGWRLQLLRWVNRCFRVSEFNASPRWPVDGAGGLRFVLQRGQG